MAKERYIVVVILFIAIVAVYYLIPDEIKTESLLEGYYEDGHLPAALGVNNKLSQSFSIREPGSFGITKAVFYLHVSSVGSTGNVQANLYTANLVSGEPETLLETSGPVDIETITITSAPFTFMFDGTTSIDSNVTHHIVLEAEANVKVGYFDTDVYDGGERWTWAEIPGWSMQTHDFAFELWGAK